jgi:alpha-amylase
MTVTSLDEDVVMVSKSPLVSILTNRGSSGATDTYTIPQNKSGWGNNIAVLDVISCTQYETGSDGALSMSIENGMPRVLIEASKKGGACVATTQGNKDNGAREGVRTMGGLMGAVAGVIGVTAMMML